MAYAPADRAFYDADSHIMELPDFLKAYVTRNCAMTFQKSATALRWLPMKWRKL